MAGSTPAGTTTMTQTLKLFQPGHTAVIFCSDSQLPQALFFDLVEPLKNIRWCEIIPSHENEVLSELEKCFDPNDKLNQHDNHDDKIAIEWFLLNLERVAPYYAQLSNFEKFAKLLLAVDQFAASHHLKMIVSLTMPDNDAAQLAAQILAAYCQNQSTAQNQHLTTLTLTSQAPFQLTIQTGDDDEGDTIEYTMDAKGHFTEIPLPTGEQTLLSSIRATINQMNQLAEQLADGQDPYTIGRSLGALVMEEHDTQHTMLETTKITTAIKNEFKRHNETIDALLGKPDSPVSNGYNDYLAEHHAAEKWTEHAHDED